MRSCLALALFSAAAILASATSAQADEIDWQKVDAVFGRAATVSGDVHRYGFPRSELRVTVDRIAIRPAFALGGWVAFQPMESGAMVMGDLVLLETEINQVMSKLIENGIEITALHNHLLRANPAIFYMHIGGQGDPVKLADAIRAALAESNTPLEAGAASEPPGLDFDTAQIEEILGVSGKANGGVYQFAVVRREAITVNGMELDPAAPTGVATAINFQPTSDGKAAITGDFVLTAEEVNPVIRALHSHDIEVAAIHSHMLQEEPRLFFMHFWASGDPLKLAHGLRAALDKTERAE